MPMALALTLSDFSPPPDGVNAILFSFLNPEFPFIFYCGHTVLMKIPIKLGSFLSSDRMASTL